jgi:hypothetical protein
MVSRKWWLAGLGLACASCVVIPLLGGAAIGAGAGMAFGSGWGGLALLGVGAMVAGMVALRPGRTADACAANGGCGCGVSDSAPAPGADEKPPIACTLTGDDFAQRTAWIRQLANEHLSAVRRTPLSLELTYAPAAAAKVRDMVRKEQLCCAFLTFDLRETEDGIHLTVTAPEEARDAADMLFDHFAPGALDRSQEASR